VSEDEGAARDETDALVQAPIRVKLCGGQEFEIPCPMAGAALAWAKKYTTLFAEIGELSGLKIEDMEDLREHLPKLFSGMPERIVDLFFDFAGESVDRDRVLAETSLEELSAAFQEVVARGNPLARMFGGTSSRN